MQIGIGHNTVLTHIAFALGRFFCKNVAFESFLESDFTSTGNFKALFALLLVLTFGIT